MISPPPSESLAATPPWPRRLGTPGAILRLVLLVVLVLPALNSILDPLDRGMRSLSLVLTGVPLALFVVVALSLGRHLAPRGILGRRSGSAFTAGAAVLGALSCCGPIPFFYWKVIDPLANRRELALVRSGLAPLVRSLGDEARRAGRPPEDIAPILARQDPGTLRYLGRASSTGFVRYFRGRDRFALAVRGTPAHRDSFAVILYTPWDDRWQWRDESYGSGADHGALAGAAGEGLQEWQCLAEPSDAPRWTCERQPASP